MRAINPAVNPISVFKKYVTRSGMPARILATDLQGGQPIAAAVQESSGSESLRRYDPDGTYLKNPRNISGLDLFEVPPWHGLEIDTLVLCKKFDEGGWYNAYFAGVNEAGSPMVWAKGTTSKTASLHTPISHQREYVYDVKLPEEA